MSAQSIPELLRNTAQKYPTRLALRQPIGKEVQTWTWAEYLQAAEEIAAGLRTLGLGKGDHAVIC